MAIYALRSDAGFGWPGWGGNQKLVSEVTAFQTREAHFPAIGVWKPRVRLKSADAFWRRGGLWEALMEDTEG